MCLLHDNYRTAKVRRTRSLLRPAPCTRHWQVIIVVSQRSACAHWLALGELDNLISTIPHTHLVMAPVFGAPPVAEAAQLIVVMAGDYRSKKEIAHLFIPAVGRKVIDLGGNLEKGMRLL